ncbi:peptide synthetase [Actinomadura logoneensis]|uniref:Peptide synthetase n=1 Tax=Actinomadura logoneensis TaxID=2293572 RepID=A0A372JR90_9ACTN|nr:fatty acyl-AMP ligase [Actinomadura logoneensis]RFU41878.1 peptide synthetase [Actinomadura logoneensis]
MNEHSTLVELMCARAAEHGDRTALVFSADPFRPERDEILTYQGLDQAARRVAALLQARFAAGARVLVLHPTGPAFAESFLGCVYAGMVPVAAPTPHDNRRLTDRVAAIARDADAVAALVDASDLETLTAWAKERDLPEITLLAPASEVLPPADAWKRPPADPGALVFLQYTSGSTSDPKGVMVDHANLLANARLLSLVLDVDSTTVTGGWLPMYHDFGLIGLLLSPLIMGAHTVLMPTMAFLKRPHAWLTLIDRYDIDFSPAPNFAFEFVTRRVTDAEIAELDLSRWRLAVNGAEPVRAATLEEFARRFAPAGLPPTAPTPGYGMAETTLVVCGNRSGHPPVVTSVDRAAYERGELVPAADGAKAHRLVSCGPAEVIDILVVEPLSRRPLPDGRVGEIWVRGPNIARGYWNRPEETARVFAAATADGDSGYLRTGDLGVLWKGELYVTGRLKEVIIVRGGNLYPQDLEAVTHTAHPSLERGVGAAFAVSAPDEGVVIVRECRERDPGGLADVAGAVRDRLSREYGVNAHGVVLVRPGGVARTTSGKIQRRLVRRQFLTGGLDCVYADLSPALRAALPAARTGETAR